MSQLKKIYRELLNRSKLLTFIQVQRFKKNYPTKILNTIVDSNLPTIHYVHRYITNNTGDLACGYYKYFLSHFKEYNVILHDVNYVHLNLVKENDIIIVGGGGLLNATAEWNYNINKAAQKAAKAVIWSAGFNSNQEHKLKFKVDFNLFDLVSVRDYNYGDFDYVPCATCCMPEINKEYRIKRRVGVLAHKDVPEHISNDFKDYEKVANNVSLQEMVEFIGTSEIILSNSYHAIYWGTLLNKKSILFSPRGEKYYYFKYKPITYSGNLENDIMLSKIEEESLNDSKGLTSNFLEQIKELIQN